MYYSSGNYEAFARPRKPAGVDEIAEARSVSLNTVRTQLRTLYRKLGAANRSEALANAARLTSV